MESKKIYRCSACDKCVGSTSYFYTHRKEKHDGDKTVKCINVIDEKNKNTKTNDDMNLLIAKMMAQIEELKEELRQKDDKLKRKDEDSDDEPFSKLSRLTRIKKTYRKAKKLETYDVNTIVEFPPLKSIIKSDESLKQYIKKMIHARNTSLISKFLGELLVSYYIDNERDQSFWVTDKSRCNLAIRKEVHGELEWVSDKEGFTLLKYIITPFCEKLKKEIERLFITTCII
jgi:hypothetical protein